MSISRVKVWNAGDILTAADLNAEFNNIINNAISLVSPLTGTLNVNNQQLTNTILELQAATQSSAAGTQGRIYYQTTEALIHVDTGIVTGGTGQNPGPGGIARVPVLQGVQAGDIPYASPFYQSSGERLKATGFQNLRVASKFQVIRSGSATPNLPGYVDVIAGSGIGVTHNAGNITLSSGLALAGALKGSASGSSYTTTAGGFVDVDATNLKATVTIPTGAQFLLVWVELTPSFSGQLNGNYFRVLAAGSEVGQFGLNAGVLKTFGGYSHFFGVLATPTSGSQTIALQFQGDGVNATTILNPSFEGNDSLVPRLTYLIA